MYKLDIIKDGIKIAEVNLPSEPSYEQREKIIASYIPNPKPIQEIILTKLEQYQAKARKLINKIYMSNTLAGITPSQSVQMFKDYVHVLNMIRDGAWTSAITELQSLEPMGFATQELHDNWISIIESEM